MKSGDPVKEKKIEFSQRRRHLGGKKENTFI